MLRLALIGERLGHSLSPLIHGILSRETGIALDYRCVEIPSDALSETLPHLLDELDGLNVTIPYKERVIPLLDEVDEAARTVGAVNTISHQVGRTVGSNTDVPGFQAMLRATGLNPHGQPCFVLGTGGASKAVTAALRQMGASSVTLVSRHPSGEIISYDELPERFSGLLVNTTPLGMWPQTEGCPLTQAQLTRVLNNCSGVADVIYNPAETRLTLAAKAQDIPACTGAVMLAAQALEAERIWTGQDLPDALIAPMVRGIRQALAK